MLLRSVRVENFRAIKSAQLSLDPTTVLIGENDCGRSSILEAIALALGWNAPEDKFLFQPFHVHREEHAEEHAPIRIELEFAESRSVEWEGEGFETLRERLPDLLTPQRRFWLEVTCGETAVHWSFRTHSGFTQPDDPALLAWLRWRVPVFRTAEGMLAGSLPATVRKPLPEGGIRDLADEVSALYRDVIAGTAPDLQSAVEAGAEAAKRLMLARGGVLTHPRAARGAVLEEITGKKSSRRVAQASGQFQAHGSAAQKIGILLLVGALLRSGAAVVQHGMDPLVLIEDPEAHLHPMTLASIWSVMERLAGQKIIATHSGTLLASARLSSLRRLTRQDGLVREWLVPEGKLNAEELRRYAYHLRSRRAEANFARCWLLVEGETEYWLMSELARVCGHELASEGVACVEFAQCGLGALVKVARHLGIEWHLLADGDHAGQDYARSASRLAGPGGARDRITLLREADIEACFWRYGFADVFRKAAYPSTAPHYAKIPARSVIQRAIQRNSKPFLAVLLLDAVIDRGPASVPAPLKKAIETCIRLARRA